jgi:serine/threonine-protein kinase
MAPEQATADPFADHRADLYSVGALAYELITGAPPFDGGSVQSILARHVTEAPRPVAEVRPIPPALAGLIMRALEKRPADRFQSADEMLEQLETLATPGGGITPTETRPVRAHPARRRAVGRAGIAIGVVAVAAAALLGVRQRGPAPAGAAAADTMPSVGVVPFTEINQPAGQEYFADGLTEEVIAALSRMPSLRVPGRASSMHFRGSRAPLRAIAESLQVRSLLTASIQRAGERVRIRAELVNPADGFQLWSDTYDERLEDLFAVYDRVAQSIAGALKVRLTARESAPRVAALAARKSASPEAYDAYLLGRYQLNRRSPGSVDSARIFFERAIAADSNFGLAWSGLAEALVLSGPGQYRVPGVDGIASLRRALAAARRAAALAPEAVEAQTALAFALDQDDQWDAADSAWARALALDPNYPPARHWHATHLVALDRLQDAVAEFRRAEALDPMYWISSVWLALTLSAQGRHDAAADRLDQLIARYPGIPRLRSEAALVALRRGDFDRAAAEYGLFLEMAGDSALARRARADLRSRERRAPVIRELATGTFVGLGGARGVDIAMYGGEREVALELLERLQVGHGDLNAASFRVGVTHPELRRTATWQEHLRRMGVP